MPDISGLPPIATLVVDTDVLAIVSGGDTRKVTVSASPGAASRILATDVNGSVAFGTNLLVIDVPADTVSFGGNIVLENGEEVGNAVNGIITLGAAVAEGVSTLASGAFSHAEGNATTASGDSAHAEGISTLASGGYSHAEGNSTIASGSYSHAEGVNTVASGGAAHAQGYGSEASGDYSFAAGRRAKATAGGVCVITDSQNADFTINTVNTFGARFAGGYQLMGGDIGFDCVPTAKLDINSDILRLRTAKTPASAGAAGNQGDICWDANFIYVCVAANTWERAAIATW